MFTGLIQDVGTLVGIAPRGSEAYLIFSTSLKGIEVGESIAVMGACLSVTEAGRGRFTAFASSETLAKTGLQKLKSGASVNLERALRLDDLVGGHLVTGHVDARVELMARSRMGEAVELTFALPKPPLAEQIAPKGSVAVDGVSLTVNDVQKDRFDVMVIPLTLDRTTLSKARTKELVNIETDILAKYVARRLERGDEKRGGVDMDLLESSGFLGR
jgi:riboflavin synthase